MKSTTIYDCSIIEIDKHHHDKGNISVVENGNTVNFDVKRIYYLYDVPGGESRGGHAHKDLYQFMIAASGSFDVILNDGELKRTISLNRPYRGLLIVPGIWRELENFSSGSVCLVLASLRYNESDYIRDYDQFKEYKKISKGNLNINQIEPK
ncbi:MAG: WxcM-like domain-containing protein [Proteiniphilum sp.]|mgnify:FL=1|nr:WxcM-like domain-containing protein [Proteiniphilum sp.]